MALLGSGIDKEHIAKFDELADNRFNNIPVEAVLAFLIDIVAADALFFLAENFDVLGYKGWILASTESEKRELIKEAIRLHRKKGTPWSIIEALRVLGYPDVRIVENIVGATYNGTYSYNGSINYDQPGPFTFRVLLNAASSGIITGTELENIIEIIKIYKNARSHLVDVSFGFYFQDNVTISESLDIDALPAFSSTGGTSLRYRGLRTYDGSSDYDGDSDVLTINIIS